MAIDAATLTEGPVAPFVAMGNRGFVQIYDSYSEVSRASLYSLCRGFFAGLCAYDRNGSKWTVHDVEAPYKVNVLTRLLAYTVYNPKFTVRLKWQSEGRYDLADLQQALERAIERNDDVLTQHVSAQRLTKIVRSSKTYEQLIGAMRKHRVA